jgi:hypothetical protein
MVSVDLHFDKGSVSGTVALPEGLPGVFRWRGKDIAIAQGVNNIAF